MSAVGGLAAAGGRTLAAALVLAALCAAALGQPSDASGREPLDVRLFARVPDPGLPEGIAVDREARRVYVGTSPKDAGAAGKPPSKVFAYSRRGRLRESWTIGGQDRSDPSYGLYGIALDRAGRLYIADFAPARIIRLNPRTGRQRDYVRFPNLPPCSLAGGDSCSDTVGDLKPFPNSPVFGPDGALYVTDLNQALVWRVPPGGEPEVWLTDSRFEGVFGPNGAGFSIDRNLFGFVVSQRSATAPAGFYAVGLKRNGEPREAQLLWEDPGNCAPDGFAQGRSGRIYVTCAGGAFVLVLSPSGEELDRTAPDASAGGVRFDAPANIAFLGRRLLVTNHAWISRNEANYAVLDVFAGERGIPPVRPRLRRRASGAGRSG